MGGEVDRVTPLFCVDRTGGGQEEAGDLEGMLARFDDLAKLRVKNMLFFPEGVLLCMPIRKNRQFGGYMWVPLAESGRRIRAMTPKQAAHWEQARRLAGDAAYVTHTAAQSAARSASRSAARSTGGAEAVRTAVADWQWRRRWKENGGFSGARWQVDCRMVRWCSRWCPVQRR